MCWVWSSDFIQDKNREKWAHIEGLVGITVMPSFIEEFVGQTDWRFLKKSVILFLLIAYKLIYSFSCHVRYSQISLWMVNWADKTLSNVKWSWKNTWQPHKFSFPRFSLISVNNFRSKKFGTARNSELQVPQCVRTTWKLKESE